jgi:signal transduction histidine kinase
MRGNRQRAPGRNIAPVLPTAAFPGPAAQARLAGRLCLAVFAVLVGVGLLIRLSDNPAALVIGAVAAIAGGIPLFLLSLRPVLSYTAAAVATAGVVVLGNADSRSIVWFALLILAAWCVLAYGAWVGGACWAGAALIFGGEWLWAIHDPGWAPWVGGLTVTVLAALLIRHEFVLVERLRAAQADLAERSRVEERGRIARELHDVIAHSLTVSLLHVTSARLAVDHDPGDASRALAEAERLGRQALTEVRATMGLLRLDDPGGIARPVPGFGQVPQLVGEFRGAGVQVTLTVDGDPSALPQTVGSTIYRIVQEALTNAARHAPGAPVTVDVTVADQNVTVLVDSAGPPGQGSGMGLINMAERAGALGGSCTAGPGGHGWLVTATLPRRAEGSPAR